MTKRSEEPYFAELIADSKVKKIPIEKLTFDTENIRFVHISEKKSQKEMEKTILADPKINDLLNQILSAKTILEPLVVDSEYKVIEGNRRLACLRELNKEIKIGKLEGIPDNQFKKVDCRVLPKNVNPKTLDLYLASLHVRGKLPWKLFNRAKHIYRLNMSHGMSYDEIAEKIGMGKATISQMISAYKALLTYSRRFEDKDWVQKFTYFHELFKKKSLREFLEEKDFLNRFSKWVFDKKFHDVRDVRRLKEVLLDEDATKEIEKSKFTFAIQVLEGKNPGLTDRNFKVINETIEYIRSVSRQEQDNIISNPAKMKLLNNLEAEVKNLLIDIDARKGRTKK